MQKKILLIDDTHVLARSLADLLSMEGYDVLIAASAIKALAVVPQFQPDLIITDLIMPEMDGLEFTRHFKSLNSSQSIPVIILTADTNEKNRSNAAQAGADLLLYKPFNYDALITHIANLT